MMTLGDSLKGAGKPTEAIPLPGGGTILVLPHGGRVLGLFAAGSGENFFWTHPALASPDTARDFYESGEWQNSGGDRTWLAPEADFFFPDFPNTSKYWQPRALEPGEYRVSKTPGGLRLTNRLQAVLTRSKRTLDLVISKSLSPAPNPLRYERDFGGFPDISYAGYTLQTALDVEGERELEFPVRSGYGTSSRCLMAANCSFPPIPGPSQNFFSAASSPGTWASAIILSAGGWRRPATIKSRSGP